MKQLWKTFSYLALGLGSFILFFYLTFPYEVLKETVILKASEVSGLNIQIGNLSPGFPLGVRGEKLKISSTSGSKIQLNSMDLSVRILPLFLGNISVQVDLEDVRSGRLDLEIGVSIFDLLKGQYPIWPSKVYLEAERFLFGDLIDFVLKREADSPDVNPLVKPLLESIDVDGRLTANIDLKIDTSDLKNSEGKAVINLTDMVLKSLNSNLPIPDQAFTKALIKAKLNKGALIVDDTSGFTSQDLNIGIGGRIIQKPQLERSDVDFTIPITLGPPLQEQLGIILDAVAQRETKGVIKLRINGALSPGPSINIL